MTQSPAFTPPAEKSNLAQPEEIKATKIFDNLGIILIEELAAALHRSPKTIRNWVAKREIPFLLIQGRVAFRRSSIEAWLDRKEFKPWR